MRPLLSLVLLLSCAIVRKSDPSLDTQVWARSHNGSEVDVYLLCGDQDAKLLDSVPERGTATFSIAPSDRTCASWTAANGLEQPLRRKAHESIARHDDVIVQRQIQ
jgi:hypothetical protein